jgi:hypothetical protein
MRWIALKDQLPKRFEFVIVANCNTGEIGFDGMTAEDGSDWHSNHFKYTHWMPLPDPPEKARG